MSTSIRWSVATFAFSVSAFLAGSAIGQETTFRWKFKPGQVLKSNVTQIIEQSLPNSQQPVTQDCKLEQTWEVVSVGADQTAKMRTTLTSAQLTMKIPGAGEVELDTSKPAENDTGLAAQLGKMFRPMIGQPCENDMHPTGKVTNVVIPEQAMTGFKNLPLGDSMGSVLTDSIEKGSPVFPTEAIAPGYSWTQEHVTKTPVGSMNAANKITYVGPEVVSGRKLHKFNLELSVKFVGENSLSAQIDIPEQSAKGTLLFDNENGYLVSSDMDQSMKMNIKVAGQNSIESTTVQKMKTTFTPVKTGSVAR